MHIRTINVIFITPKRLIFPKHYAILNTASKNDKEVYKMKRNANIDLFRIIATLLVIMLHVLGKGRVIHSAAPGSATFWTAWFLEICALCAVNCFALISGYVMVNKTIKAKSLISLWFQVLFYSLLITALCFIFMPDTISLSNVILAFLPVIGKRWWYVSAYFALFIFLPFINEALRHISQTTYRKFLIIILVGVCMIDCVIPLDAFGINDGYSAIWLMIVYLFGAYIRKYGVLEKITALHSLLGFFTMAAATFASKFALNYIGITEYEDTFTTYHSITILLSAIFLFFFCMKIKLSGAVSKVILFLSPVTLSVYLIHVHPLIFYNVIKSAFASFASKSPVVMALCVIAATLAIFVICAAIDLIRIQLFKLIRVNKLCEFADKKIRLLYGKVFKDKSEIKV